MYQRSVLAILLVSLLVVSSTGVLTAAAQVYTELLARARLFPEVGPGFRALRRCPEGRAPGNSQTRPQETLPDRYEQSSAGRYYVLTMPGAVQVYNVQGQRVGQIPAARPSASKDTALFYGDDLDVDSAGRVYVADRGANAVKCSTPTALSRSPSWSQPRHLSLLLLMVSSPYPA